MSDGIKLLDCVQVLQLLVALSSFLTPLTAPYTSNEVCLHGKSSSRAHVRGCNGSDDPSGTLGITVAGSERP